MTFPDATCDELLRLGALSLRAARLTLRPPTRSGRDVHHLPEVRVTRRTRSLLLLAAVAIAALAGAVVWVTHSASAEPSLAPIEGNFSVDEARAFNRFPLYYAGESVMGEPLMRDSAWLDRRRRRLWANAHGNRRSRRDRPV